MKIANIILFHKYPVAVERLVKVLNHPNFDFYLHLDKKVKLKPFAYLSDLANTTLIKNRTSVRWAGYSQLAAFVNSLDEILNNGKSYDFINLLSGQDYPIKPVNEINKFLSLHIGKSFMMSETPPSTWWDDATLRFTKYHFWDYDFRGKHRLGDALSKIMPARQFPLPLKLFGGPYASYRILSIEAARYIHSILNRKDKFFLFFKHTWAPDEFLINTLLMNSPLKDTIINENFHYMDRSLGGPRPKILTTEDFTLLKNSDKFFARKFDINVDMRILEMIDDEILFVNNTKP